jgi:hypothetical protein
MLIKNVQDKNTSLKLPVGVSPLQFVNLHRNRRYFVIKLHTRFCLSYFVDKHKILLHLSIFYEYQQFFQHRICFSIQPPDYSDLWPTLARSTSFFLNNKKNSNNYRIYNNKKGDKTHRIKTIPKSNQWIVETCANYMPLTHI